MGPLVIRRYCNVSVRVRYKQNVYVTSYVRRRRHVASDAGVACFDAKNADVFVATVSLTWVGLSQDDAVT